MGQGSYSIQCDYS